MRAHTGVRWLLKSARARSRGAPAFFGLASEDVLLFTPLLALRLRLVSGMLSLLAARDANKNDKTCLTGWRGLHLVKDMNQMC